MTDEKLGALLEAFANYYWSVPVRFVESKIAEWHPDVDAVQLKRVLNRCDKNILWHHCYVEKNKVKEPELVTEHLVAVSDDDLDQFLSARIDAPICDCDEEMLFKLNEDRLDIPEATAIIDFGKSEFGLDDGWAAQLIRDCTFHLASALCDGKSWIMEVLSAEQFGQIHFQTVEQVKRFRILGNSLYQVFPNPVLRGWKPAEIDNPPVLIDEIPEKDEDIPDGRKKMDELFAPYGGREKVRELFMQHISESVPKRKIGRNEPCPCGSGKKYKKCCGR